MCTHRGQVVVWIGVGMLIAKEELLFRFDDNGRGCDALGGRCVIHTMSTCTLGTHPGLLYRTSAKSLIL